MTNDKGHLAAPEPSEAAMRAAVTLEIEMACNSVTTRGLAMKLDALTAALGDARAQEAGEVAAWQWFSCGTWHTIDKTNVADPETYARSFWLPVRAIYASAVPPAATSAQISELDNASNACLELAAKHGFATGHGDTVADMIREFSAQIPVPPAAGLALDREKVVAVIEDAMRDVADREIYGTKYAQRFDRARAEKATDAILALSRPAAAGDVAAEIIGLVEAVKMARNRLERFADDANAGLVHYSPRELKRKIWGAFADVDAALTSTKGGSVSRQNGEGGAA